MPEYKFKRNPSIDESEMKTTLEAIRKPWLKSLTVFLYLAGCRISEALKMKRKDFWIEGDLLVVRIYVLKKKSHAQTPYDTNIHVLHFSLSSPFLKEVLLPYLEAIPSPEARVWYHSRQWSWTCLKKANSNLSPHCFRHSRLTKLALQGASPFDLTDWAGWADSRPAQNYIHASGQLALKFADKLT